MLLLCWGVESLSCLFEPSAFKDDLFLSPVSGEVKVTEEKEKVTEKAEVVEKVAEKAEVVETKEAEKEPEPEKPVSTCCQWQRKFKNHNNLITACNLNTSLSTITSFEFTKKGKDGSMMQVRTKHQHPRSVLDVPSVSTLIIDPLIFAEGGGEGGGGGAA